MNNEVICKLCGSKNTRKYGLYKTTQHYFCNDCRREFSSDDKLYRMKTPANQVSSAIDMYYKGMSVNDIKDNLNQQYHNCPSTKTVYEWIRKYTDESIDRFKDYHPTVGNTWIADETVLRIGGQNVWMYDIIDVKTRYLLASQLAESRTIRQTKMLMEKAAQRAGKTPNVVITDSNNTYPEGIERAYGGDTRHIQSEPFADFNDTQLIERFHSTLKDRTKVMRGLKSLGSAQKFIEGWLIYYNYLRPHESLDNKTPAEESKIDYPLKTWVDITRMAEPQVKVLTTQAKVSVLGEDEPFLRPVSVRHYHASIRQGQRRLRTMNTRRWRQRNKPITRISEIR